MFKSLKTKLLLILSLLIVFLLSVSAVLLIAEKSRELTRDIFLRAKSFVELATPEIIADWDNLLDEGAFILFNSKINEVSGLNQDIKRIRLVHFTGKILYDSQTESVEQYVGAERLIKDQNLLTRIRAKNLSLNTQKERTIFLKSQDGDYYAVDENEKSVPDLDEDERVRNLVLPYRDQFAVIYDVSYDLLTERIARTRDRIVLLTIFGVLLGLGVGVVASNRVTGPLIALKEAVLVIASGDFQKRVEVSGKDEVATLSESVNKMAEDLQKSTKALVYKERVAKELELAAVMQRQLLPRYFPQVAGLDIAAGLIPAAEVGGDLYDFISPQPDRLLAYVGDVTGHGVPAGILGAIANSLVYGLADKSLTEILIEANRILHAKSTQSMFLTMLICEWNPQEREFNYLSAGHEKMIFYRQETGQTQMMEAGGLALGMLPDIKKLLTVRSIKPRPGDIAILYTDGIPEAWRNEKEMYGFERFLHAVKHFADLRSAEAIKNAIMADVRHFIGRYRQMDDITLIVFKWV